MVNIDPSFYIQSGTRSTGAAIRDSTGGFIASSQRKIPYVSDALMVWRWNNIYGAIDLSYKWTAWTCLTLVVGGYSGSAGAAIYNDCNKLCLSSTYDSIEYCNWEANKVTHESWLSLRLQKKKHSCIWADESPIFLLEQLCNYFSRSIKCAKWLN